jgi:hypothetical protein
VIPCIEKLAHPLLKAPSFIRRKKNEGEDDVYMFHGFSVGFIGGGGVMVL